MQALLLPTLRLKMAAPESPGIHRHRPLASLEALWTKMSTRNCQSPLWRQAHSGFTSLAWLSIFLDMKLTARVLRLRRDASDSCSLMEQPTFWYRGNACCSKYMLTDIFRLNATMPKLVQMPRSAMSSLFGQLMFIIQPPKAQVPRLKFRRRR